MTNENPFLKMETDVSTAESKRTLAKALKEAEFSAGMRTGQFSEYHTEGEKVADHYRLIFNVMNAILDEDNEKLQARLSKSMRDSLGRLDDSIKKTIKEYPSLLRYVILTHDIAKRRENRTFNAKKFKMPEEDFKSELSSEVLDAAEEYSKLKTRLDTAMSESEMKIKEATKEIKTLEKAINNKKMDPEQSVELRRRLEDQQAMRKTMQEVKDSYEDDLAKHTVAFYDKLQSLGLSGANINKFFGLGVGFIKHEEKSAETVRGMNIPDGIKALLAKLADDHIVPLNRFADPKMDDGAAATFFVRTYGDYAPEEFRLSMAMAALDVLGSLRIDGEPDLTPIENILRGKREVWIQQKVAENLYDAVQSALNEDPDYAELRNVDLKDKNTPIELKQKYSKMKKSVEAKLREKFSEEFGDQGV